MDLEQKFNDPDSITDDMIKNGEIRGTSLFIYQDYWFLGLDLRVAIHRSLISHKPSLIQKLLHHDVDITSIEPRIMTLVVNAGMDDVFIDLFTNQKYCNAVSHNNYECVYRLARDGRLDLITLVMDSLILPVENEMLIQEIIGKVIVQAVLNNHINILRYYLTPDVFRGAPDQMWCYFMNAVTYKSSKDVLKFFVESGLCVEQDGYAVIKQACQTQNCVAYDYFTEICPNHPCTYQEQEDEFID